MKGVSECSRQLKTDDKSSEEVMYSEREYHVS